MPAIKCGENQVNKSTYTSNKDSAVELARFFGALIVIGVHIWGGQIAADPNNTEFSRRLIQCFVADGVAVFWIIAGFFMFRNFNYKKIMKRTLTHVSIPMMLICALAFFIVDPYLATGSINILHHTSQEYLDIFNTIIRGDTFVYSQGHMWYIFVYIILMAVSPALYGLIKYLEEDPKRVKCFFAITAFMFLLNDFTHNEWAGFGMHTFSAAVPAAIQMVWGYFLYKNKEFFQKKINILWGILAFFGLNLLRCVYLMHRLQAAGDIQILYWYTGVGTLAVIAGIICCFALVGKRSSRIANVLGGATFGVYLIHPCIVETLQAKGYTPRIEAGCLNHFTGITLELAYFGIMLLSVAGLSFAIVLLYQLCKWAVLKLLSKKKIQKAAE